MKKYMNLLGMMAVALMAASCSNDISDVQVPEQIAKDGTIHFTATLAPKTFDATTRALTESTDHTLLSNWQEDEEICLTYTASGSTQNVRARVYLDDKGVAHISATLTGDPTDGTSVTLFYPYESYNVSKPIAEQDGKLSNKLDIRKGTGAIKVDGSNATVDGKINLAAQYAIMHIDLFDSDAQSSNLYADKLAIFLEGNKSPIVTVNPDDNTVKSGPYIALPALESKKVRFWAFDSDNVFFAEGTANLEVGKYYKTEVKMGTVGNVIGADGKFCQNADEAIGAGTTAEAVIALIVQPDEIDGGVFAVALQDYNPGNTMDWNAANSGLSTWSTNHPMPFGEWCIPAASIWMSMFDKNVTLSNEKEKVSCGYGDFRTLLTNAGGDDADVVYPAYYWTSTTVSESDSGIIKWVYRFADIEYEGSPTAGDIVITDEPHFEQCDTRNSNHVRYVLFF